MSGPVTGFDPGFSSEFATSIPVQDQPTKIGKVQAGSLIINDSLTSRVWLADQPTQRGSEYGVPLDPKTSIVWTKTSLLYIVADASAASAADVIITRQASAWTPSPSDIATLVAQQAFSSLAQTLLNTGSRIIDQPFVAARANLTSGVEQAAFFNVSAALYQSYTLTFKFTNGVASPTNYAQVEVRFYDDSGNVVWRDLIEVNVGGSEVYVTDRMHGQYMKVMPTFSDGTVGAFLDGSALGTSGWTANAAEWFSLTGVPLLAGRWYAGTTYTIGTTLSQMIAAGVRICLDLAPPYNPVSSTDRDGIASLLAALQAAGADVRVSLWHEPFLGGLSAAQYVAMVQYYGPTVRQYYPLWCVFSENDTVEANGYFPGTAYVDGIAADCYATNTANLDNCQTMADAHGLPLGLWEFNAAFDLGIDPSPVTGITNAQGVTFINYVRDLFLARLTAGKRNGDVLFFSSKATSTGTSNFLGDANSQAGGFENGIANWVAGANNTVAQSNAQAHSGSNSLKLVCTVAGTIAASHCQTANILSQGLPVSPGDTVAVSVWLRPETTARNVRLGVFWYNAAGAFLSNNFHAAVVETGGAWKFFSHTAVAPANAARAKLQTEIDTVALGEGHYLEDPQMGVLPASVDHTAPIQYPWDYRIAPLASLQSALAGANLLPRLFCNWIMSNRPIARLNYQEKQNNDRVLVIADQITVGAGGTSGYHYLPGFHGPCDIYIRVSATVDYVAEFYFGSLPGIAFRLSGAAGADSFRETLLPLRPLRYRIKNNGGVAADFFTSVWTRDN